MPFFTVRRGSVVTYRGPSLTDALAPAPLRFFSVCSGIEAASVAWKPLGWKCVSVAEIEKFPSAVLAHHYPDVPNYGDFTKIRTRTLGRVDILCGGTPCQAFSVAGARNSLDDARGNLTLAFVGLAHELADGNGLRNVVWENVPGVLSTKDNAFGCFLAGLVGASEPFIPAEPAPAAGKSNRAWGWSAKQRAHYIKWPRAGMVTGPKGRAAWTVKDAQYFGLAQRRERVIVVADFGNGADPAAVLFEPESVRRDSPPSREAGQGFAADVAPSLVSSGRGVERAGDTRGQDPVVSVLRGHSDYGEGVPSLRAKGGDCAGGSEALVAYSPTVGRTLLGGGHTNNPLDENLVVIGVTGPISHALKAEGADASEDGTGRGTPIVVAFQGRGSNIDLGQDVTGTLSQNCDRASGGAPCVTVALRGRENGGTAELGDAVAFALRASSGGGDKPHVLTHAIQAGALRENPNSGPDGVGVQADICYTLEARAEVQAVQFASAVRRLTPRECERLQGFQWQCSPDYPGAWQDHNGRWWSPDYTAIPIKHYATRKVTKNRPAEMWRSCPSGGWWLMAADGPRYKTLGNSWAVPKFRWLGERIARLMPPRF